MTTGYALAYALHLTPWEKAGASGAAQLATLLAREEADLGHPGRALDLGCGSGRHSIALAKRGWQVTGVDQIARALKSARRLAAQAGVPAKFVQADLTALDEKTVGDHYDLFLDIGCLHGFDESERAALGRVVTSLARLNATALVLAFRPGVTRPPLPRGADATELERAFPNWRVIDVQPAGIQGMPAPLRKAAPQWYRLRHNA